MNITRNFYGNEIEIVTDYSRKLGAGETLFVQKFGKNEDLNLFITKDDEYDPADENGMLSFVSIIVRKDKQDIETIEDVHTDTELKEKLEEISRL